MKRILSVLLILLLLFTSCATEVNSPAHEHPPHDSSDHETPDSPQDDNPDTVPDDQLGNDQTDDCKTHQYQSIVTAPTCSSEGYTTYICTLCGESYVSDRVSALEHTYNAVQTPPTCNGEGYTTYTCSGCGDSYIADKLPLSGHNYHAVVTEPTCTADGYTTYTCTCGHTYVDDRVAANGHIEEIIVGRAATCTASGLTDGKKCSACGVILENQTEIPAKGHDYQTSVIVSSCTGEGYTTHTCSVCGDSYVSDQVSAEGHTEVTIPGREATCTASGLTDGKKCSACGVILENQTVIPAKGHNYSATVTDSTCTSEGYTTHTCSVCGDSYVSDRVSAEGHTEVTVPGREATCTASGLTDGKKCSACGVILENQTVIPAKGHNYSATVTDSTCTSEGYTTHTCSVCGDSYVSDRVSAEGHTEATVPGKEATCTASGLTDGKKCSACGVILENQTEIPAKGHSYTATVTAPTCTSEGYTTHTCSVCGDSYVSDKTSASGHTEVTVTGKEATCTASGLTDGKKCSACGAILENQTEIPAKGHSYTTKVTAPTCTSEGYTTYTCSVCGDSYVSDKTPASGHTEVTITGKEATCTASGLTDGKKCSACGVILENQTEIPAKGHSYTATVTAPTCTSEGYTTYTCSGCGDSYVSDKTSASGHTEVTVTGKEATCTASGLTDGKKCSACGVILENQTEIPAKGHNYTSAVTAPTCTSAGYTTHTCETCGDTYKDSTVAAKGHTPGAAATCTTDQTCTVCQVTIVVAFGHSWQDATTSAPKTCTTCGATEGDKLPSSGTSSYSETLYVCYINVGQGDSILLKVGDCDILIDAGVANKGATVSSYLKSRGVDDIELMINTHPDADHCGGLTTVLNDFTVEKVWASPKTATSNAYTNFKNAVASEGLTMQHPSVGTVYTYEYLTLTVLYIGTSSTGSNDSSIVVMAEYGNFKFLFTGDISSTVESSLVSSGKDLSCDVLKVPHHGSAGSSSASFLNATGAEYGVICVGSNSYGHPTDAALTRLSSAGIATYRTDTSGNIVFSTNGATLYLPSGGTDTSGTGSGVVSGGSSSGGSTSGGSTSTTVYIGNSESKVYHLPTCSNLPDVTKQVTLTSTAGYTPCGRCITGSSSGGSTSTTTYIANTESKVYHLPTCSNLPAASKQIVITSTAGYTPCGRCITGSSSGGSSSTTTYIANKESKVYHLPTCSNLPGASNQIVITSTAGYTPCGRCIGGTSTTKYILNTETGVYHLPTCSYLPATSKREVIYDPGDYKPCGHCIK